MFGGVLCLLIAFTDRILCYQALQKYQDKRILFITSGSLGQHIVPEIMLNLQHVFKDPVTGDPYHSIYVFCLDIEAHYNWIMEYCEYILTFTHEADLLPRMTYDMAEYYFVQAERQNASGHLKEALRTYIWSKKLYLQHKKMRGSYDKNIDTIDARTEAIKDSRRSSNSEKETNSDEENYGESPN